MSQTTTREMIATQSFTEKETHVKKERS